MVCAFEECQPTNIVSCRGVVAGLCPLQSGQQHRRWRHKGQESPLREKAGFAERSRKVSAGDWSKPSRIPHGKRSLCPSLLRTACKGTPRGAWDQTMELLV
eukprot:2581513-Amphidinium_carterae.1